MFKGFTSQDRSASKRKHKWTIGAWVMGILILSAAAPALANDSARPKSGGYRQVQGAGHSHGRSSYRSPTERQFERGLKAGLKNGRKDGFEDGKYGNGYCPRASFGCRGRSKYFQKGYRQGYKKAYENAFHRGQHQRQHERQNRRRRWIWSFDW